MCTQVPHNISPLEILGSLQMIYVPEWSTSECLDLDTRRIFTSPTQTIMSKTVEYYQCSNFQLIPI